MNTLEEIMTIETTMVALTKVLPEGDLLDGILEILDGKLGEAVDTAISNGTSPEELMLMTILNL